MPHILREVYRGHPPATEFVLDGVPIGQSGAELLEGVDHASRSLKTVLRYRNGNERASKCEAGARPCRRFERVKSFATALPRRWLSLLRSRRPVPSSQPSSGPFQGAGTRSVKASSGCSCVRAASTRAICARWCSRVLAWLCRGWYNRAFIVSLLLLSALFYTSAPLVWSRMRALR